MAEFATVDRRFWRTQLPVDFIDTSLVINVWETVSADLSGGLPTKLWYIIVEQTNNGASAEAIELEVTINGTAYTWTIGAAASGALNYCYITVNLDTGDFQAYTSTTGYSVGNQAIVTQNLAIAFKAESVGLIRTRQTSAVDVTTAQIEVNISWEKLAG